MVWLRVAMCVSLMCLTVMVGAQDRYQQLPDWAASVLQGVDLSQAPADASVWRLLDETTVKQKDDGRFEQRRRVVQYVTKSRGADRAGVFLIDGNELTTRIKKLRGWHLPRQGKMKKLDRDNVLTLGQSSVQALSRDTSTFAVLQGVARGSIVVFESREFQQSYFPLSYFRVHTGFHTRKRVVRVEGALSLSVEGLDGWDLQADSTATSVELKDIPALEDEVLMPSFGGVYPSIQVRGKGSAAAHLASWDAMARWYLDLFRKRSTGSQATPKALAESAVLEQVTTYFRDKITYRQKYLTPDRGWEPLAAKEVEDKGYGDCKDMVSCLNGRLSNNGQGIYPVMANIVDGPYTTEADLPGPLFNHLIAAFPLEKSLGLPCEVEAGGKRFLLYDPTDKYTRPGYLNGTYRDRKVLICTEEGALWVDVPEAGLEPADLKLNVTGQLDQNMTLQGQLTVAETGDAFSLRALTREGNLRNVTLTMRSLIDMPGVADLSLNSHEIDADGVAHLSFKIVWPSFFRRDQDGFRFPAGITGVDKPRLTASGKSRQNPVSLEARANMIWDLAIQTAVPLTPGSDAASYEGAHHAFTWKAQGGNNLNIHFESVRRRGYYPRTELTAAAGYWDAYRTAFNDFYHTGTLFFAR